MKLTSRLTDKIQQAVSDALGKQGRTGEKFKYRVVEDVMSGDLVIVEFTPNDWSWDEHFVLVEDGEVTKVYESSETFATRYSMWVNADGQHRRDVLFRAFVLCFLASFAVTMFGITGQIRIEEIYLKALFTGLVLQLVAAVIALFKGARFFGNNGPKQ